MISQTLSVGNFEAAVDICVDSERMVKYCNQELLTLAVTQ